MKLSELTYKEIISYALKTELSNKEAKQNIEKIVYQKNTQTLPEECDVAIIFGGVSMIPHRVETAINLYKDGLIKRLIVSGGIGYLNKNRIIPEAVKMKNYLVVDAKIPKNDILVEDKARSSFENIKYSLELIKEKSDLEKIKLALITSDFHIKRCMEMTRLATNNKPSIFGCRTKDGITDIENWTNSFAGKSTIYKEATSLYYYVRHQDMCDVEIEGLRRNRVRSK